MAWPTDDLNNTNTDQGTDNPSLARAMINTLITRVKEIIGSRGGVNGICDLDASSKVPVARLPVGTTANDVAVGNHAHSGVYEPADATILKSSAIGSSVEAFDGNIVKAPANTLPALNGSQLTNLPSSAPTTSQVLSAMAGAAVRAVGSYAVTADNLTIGSTYAGSSYGLISGTWRVMHSDTGLDINSGIGTAYLTTWLRIA